MENPATARTFFLEIDIGCCESCPRKLKKALLKIDGVDSVVLHPEKKLVAVTGKSDPQIVIGCIKGWGKTAEFEGYEGGPLNFNTSFDKKKSKSSKSSRDDKSFEHINFSKNGKERNRGNNTKSEKEENGHVPEPYVAPQIDPAICRDFYCKLHKQRPVFHNKVPSIDSADHPHHTTGFFYPGIASRSHHAFNSGNSFGYGYPMMEPSPSPYGHYYNNNGYNNRPNYDGYYY